MSPPAHPCCDDTACRYCGNSGWISSPLAGARIEEACGWCPRGHAITARAMSEHATEEARREAEYRAIDDYLYGPRTPPPEAIAAE